MNDCFNHCMTNNRILVIIGLSRIHCEVTKIEPFLKVAHLLGLTDEAKRQDRRSEGLGWDHGWNHGWDHGWDCLKTIHSSKIAIDKMQSMKQSTNKKLVKYE